MGGDCRDYPKVGQGCDCGYCKRLCSTLVWLSGVVRKLPLASCSRNGRYVLIRSFFMSWNKFLGSKVLGSRLEAMASRWLLYSSLWRDLIWYLRWLASNFRRWRVLAEVSCRRAERYSHLLMWFRRARVFVR